MAVQVMGHMIANSIGRVLQLAGRLLRFLTFVKTTVNHTGNEQGQCRHHHKSQGEPEAKGPGAKAGVGNIQKLMHQWNADNKLGYH